MSVSMKPGATTLTVMPREPISRASDLRERDDAGLRRGVVGLARVAGDADDRGDVDDAALARLHHAAHDRLRRAVDRGQVGVEDRLPVLVLHAHQQLSRVMPALLTRIEIAPNSLRDVVDQRFDRGAVGDVEHAAVRRRARRGARRSPARRRPSSRCR